MKIVRSVLMIVLLSAFGTEAAAQVLVRGHVHDAATRDDVVNANVLVVGTGTGAVTDEGGSFVIRLTRGEYTLRISAIGYAAQTHAISVGQSDLEPLHVALQPTIMLFDEVVVSSDGEFVNDLAAPPRKLNATEDLLGRVPGADFIQRGNFAWEPVIRGLSGAQVGLVIDGIKVFGACVDRMDPTSAYVEVENLEKLELSKGGFDLNNASQIGGSVNLVTEKPRFDMPFFLNTESGYESVAALRRVRVVGGASYRNTAVRGSYSYKIADDFSPGGHDPIYNSGYRKNNYKLDAAQRLGRGHTVLASVLADNAWDVGYPVLLMDATLASARIYSAAHTWEPSTTGGVLRAAETRVYYNTVDHWMDDFARDVSQRAVMRSMNMPMFGKTRTMGLLSRTNARVGRHNISFTLDGYRTLAFGDMWMFSEFPTIPDMHLLNLGDTEVRHGAVAAD
jgi:iron complex outermembrane receptor protein